MSNETFNKVLADLRKHLWKLFLLLLAISADSIAVIQFLQGHRNEFTTALFAVGTSSLWLISFYVYFKKQVEISKISDILAKRSIFPKWARLFALSGIIAIPLFVGGILGWYFYKENRPSEKIIVLVADFDGPNQHNYRVTETIIEQLREATKQYNDISVQALNESITAQNGKEVARARGKKQKAGIVLWGWYGKTDENVLITIHFEVLQKPSFLSLLYEKEIINVAVTELESFAIQTRLSNEMSYLTLLTIGLVRFEAQDYNGAIVRFNDALMQKAVPEQMINPADIYVYRGSAYLIKGDYNQAIVNYDQTIKLKPNSVEAYVNRATAYGFMQNYKQILLDCDQAIKLDPDNAIAYNIRGDAYIKKGNYDNAIADLDKAIDLQASYSEAYSNRGRAYRKKGNYDKAIADYTQAIKITRNNATFYNNRAIAYASSGKHDQAIADLNQAVKFKPADALGYFNRAKVYVNKGELQLAIADYDTLIKLEPNNAEAYNLRGFVYFQKNDYDRALIDIDQAIKLKPNNHLYYNNRGKAYFEKGNYGRALADFNHAIIFKTDFAEAYCFRGDLYTIQTKFDSAISDLEKAIAIMPNLAVAYANLGRVYRKKGDNNKALINYDIAIKLMPDNETFYNNRAVVYDETNNYYRAVADFDQAVKLNSQNATNYFNRGNFYCKRGDYKRGIGDFDQVISFEPNNAEAYHLRGKAYYNKGDYELAIADLNHTIKLIPEYADAFFGRGLAYFMKNKHDRIAINLNQNTDFKSEKTLIYNLSSYDFQNTVDQAFIDLNQAIQLKPSLLKDPNYAEALNDIAWQCALRGDRLEKVLELSKRCLQFYPENSSYWNTLAEIYYLLFRFSDAKNANNQARKYAKNKKHLEAIEEQTKKIESKLKETTLMK